MPTLTIDNKTVTVPEGANVLEAAKRLDIVIPHFCYHEALGSVGACRLCAMKFLEGPAKGIQMACMVEAKDGMVVSTQDEGAVDLRKHVIEWLMMNHPHDCPVCDEGGECQLQDMTVAGGHGIRRYGGLKRTYNNQFLGPFVYHEMNRCIQCYRCVRTYQDYCGGTDFGVLGCNQRIYFGRFRDGPLESVFSGNIVDACPTGVFTDKTFRFHSRYWDLEEASSVCPHCSLGCATIPGARYRELQRVRGGVNKETNGFFICDRGRFGYGYANHPDRPRIPRIGDREVSWDDSLEEARGRLADIAHRHGPAAIALLGSPRASLEANYRLLTLAHHLETDRIAFEAHPERDRTARVVAALSDKNSRSLEEIRNSDFLLLVGADPLNEAPMMALAVRQAVRRGAGAALIDPRPVGLPFHAVHLPLAAGRLSEFLQAVCAGTFENFSRQERTILEGIAERLRRAQRPILIGGGDLLGAAGVRDLLRTSEKLSKEDRPCGAALILGGPNSYGAALLSGETSDFNGILDGISEGRIRALVCLESDPFTDHPDLSRSRSALAKLDLLIALDCVPTTTAEKANIFLPVKAPAESAGVYVNNEGRMLAFASVFDPGTPIRVTGGGDHPPRVFEPGTPRNPPMSAWSVLGALQNRRESLNSLRREMEGEHARLAGLASLDPETDGRRVLPGGGRFEIPEIPAIPTEEKAFDLISIQSLFGSETLSAFSPVLDPVRPVPRFLMHSADAAEIGLAAGETLRVTTDRGGFELPVALSEVMARGCLFIAHLKGSPVDLPFPGVRFAARVDRRKES